MTDSELPTWLLKHLADWESQRHYKPRQKKGASFHSSYIIVSQTTYVQDSSFSITIVVHLSANCITTWCHVITMIFTWLSHDHYMNCHMIITLLSHDWHMTITWTVTWLSHYWHITNTWLSHDYHMTITLLSHDCHMTVKLGTHLAQAQGWSTVHFQQGTVCQCCTYYCPWGTQKREA